VPMKQSNLCRIHQWLSLEKCRSFHGRLNAGLDSWHRALYDAPLHPARTMKTSFEY
jgi:hypothetical protein